MLNPQSTKSSASSSRPSLFTKIKNVFSRNKRDSQDTKSLGPVASKRYSRRSSLFAPSKEAKEVKEAMDAERIRAERKSKCLAITSAKRDPPAIQRLLVDCEFCNPPPKFGRTISVPTANFTSQSAEDALEELVNLERKGTDLSDELTWNFGLDYWLQVRKWWLTKTEFAVKPHFLEQELTSDKFYTVYDKLVYHTRPLKHPLNLSDTIKIVKAGWIGEGTWPTESDSDVWTDTEEEDKQKEVDDDLMTTKMKRNRDEIAQVKIDRMSESSGEHDESQVVDEPRVQFTDQPHPRDGTQEISRELQPLERYASGMESLRPIRSTQSSMVSITDSD